MHGTLKWLSLCCLDKDVWNVLLRKNRAVYGHYKFPLGASSPCGWRNGLHIWRLVANIQGYSK